MKNPFKRKKAAKPADEQTAAVFELIQEKQGSQEPSSPEDDHTSAEDEKVPDDSFTEWGRSQVRGGIERRERNDIYEAYTVYGAGADGQLCCRRYHRYPEHDRDFGVSYSRILTFDEFNRRLLAELDRGDMRLNAYNACISKAEELAGSFPDGSAYPAYEGFTDDEEAALRAFCDDMDTLKDKSYLHSDGVLSCECESVVGGERLIIRFRKPLAHDALGSDIAGVKQEVIGGYDIDDLWIMGIYNRLRERCAAVEVTRLSSEWSIERESLYLMRAEGFGGGSTGGGKGDPGGSLLVAAGEADSFRRFGFYSLDFSKK